MQMLLNQGELSLVLLEGENNYWGLAVILHSVPYSVPWCYSYNPKIVRQASIVKKVVKGLAEGLGEFLKEFLSANAVCLEHGKGTLADCPGLNIIGALTVILANGVELQPSLPDLGKCIARILRDEGKTTLRNGRTVKTYSQFYSFSKVVEVAAAISSLEGCKFIEIHAGKKKEQGPDLYVLSNTGKEVYVEVTAKRPAKKWLQWVEKTKKSTVSALLEKGIEIDLRALDSKLKDQKRQLQSTDCIIIAGWHTSIGGALLSAIQGSTLQTVKSVEDLKGVCIYTSWIGEEPEHVLLCIS